MFHPPSPSESLKNTFCHFQVKKLTEESAKLPDDLLEGFQTSKVYAIMHDVLNVEGGRASQKVGISKFLLSRSSIFHTPLKATTLPCL